MTTLLLVTRNQDQAFICTLDKKEHPLRFLYSMAAKIYVFLNRFKLDDFFGSSIQLREIYVDESIEISRKKQAYRSIASMLIVIFGICLLVVLYSASVEINLIDGKYLRRNPSGGGKVNYELVYEYGSDGETSEKSIQLDEIRRNTEEIIKLQNYCKAYLDKTILGNNDSFDLVTEGLEFVKEIPKTNVSVKWMEDNRWIISVDGELRNRNIDEPVSITLSAELSYYDVVWEYSKDIVIMPFVPTREERLNTSLESYLGEWAENNPFDEYVELPSQLEGDALKWSEKEDNTVSVIVVLGIIAMCAIIPGLKQDIHKKQKIRREQMLKDYSDIISKFIMLLTAGMTCRAAWSKICSDYEKEYSSNKILRYAYEEMAISYKELQLGKPEVRVYEDFGIRCNVMQYQRFGTLLARNIKRGSAGVISMLELESSEAFADRRENVRKRAEEAGTKLLLPMFGMLIIVFAIVIVPAFSSF